MTCATGCCTNALAHSDNLLDTGFPASPAVEQLQAKLTNWPDEPPEFPDN